MKKIFTLCAAVMAFMGLQAEERTVWEGAEQISWNTDVAPGTQFETPEGIFAGLEKDNVIRVYTTTTYDEPQYVLTYKKGDGWDWTDLETTVADGVISYTVADDQTATEIAERGLVVRGQAYTITRITVDSEAAEEPQPVEGEQTVWEGSEQISWNTEVAPGTQFETPEGIFDGLKTNDVIRVYTTTTYDEPQYVLTYKKGDGWDWTDLTTTVDAQGTISYTVESDDIATEIAGRGLILRGQAWTATKITVTKNGVTTIVGLNCGDITTGGRIYNLRGQQVGNASSRKGIYIVNGKKIVR